MRNLPSLPTVRVANCYFVDPEGEKYTIRTVTRSDLDADVYEIFVGGWRVREYRTKRSVRDYIVKNNLIQVADRGLVADRETSARASRDCTMDWVTWANTPAL